MATHFPQESGWVKRGHALHTAGRRSEICELDTVVREQHTGQGEKKEADGYKTHRSESSGWNGGLSKTRTFTER